MPLHSAGLTVGICLFCLAIGQEGPPPASATQRPPTFRAGVELVEVAVSVTDGDGKPITDLTVGEFEVVEEGRRQAISIFQRVEVPLAGPTLSQALRTTGDVSTNGFPVEARTFVIVLDDLHIDARRTAAVRTIVRQLVERHMAQTDLVAVTATSARAEVVQDFTIDKSRIVRLAEGFRGLKPPYASFLDPVHDARAAMDTISKLADNLANVHARRVAVLFISEGIGYNIYNPADPQAMDVVRATERAIESLKGASITLYAIDPRGLAEVDEAEPAGLRDPPAPAQRVPTALTAPDARERLRLSIGSLQHVAESTGGFAAVNSNDYERGFDRIVQAVGNYYVLGYYPTELARDGESRRINVSVRRGNARVSARQGYVRRQPRPAKGTVKASERMPALARQLDRALPEPDLPLRVQTIAFKARADLAQVLVVAEVAGLDLDFRLRDGRFVETIEFASATIDAKGRRANGRSARLDLRLTPDERERVVRAGARWITVLDLPTGRYHLRVAAGARNRARSGSVFTDIDVPRFNKGPTISSIVLTSARTAGAVTAGRTSLLPQLPTSPTTVRSFVLGDVIHATAEVCAGAKRTDPPPVRLTVEARDRNDAPAIRHLTPVATRNGCGYVAVTLATEQLGPGDYVLRLDSPDDHQLRETRVTRFSVRPDR